MTGLFFVMLYTVFLLTGGDILLESRRSSFDRGNSGFFYFFRLFKQMDYQLKRWYEAEPPEGRYGCMVYLDYYPNDRKLLEGILKWVKQGNVLFIAGIHDNVDPVFSRKIRYGRSLEVEAVGDREYAFSFSTSRFFQAQPGDAELMRSESGTMVIHRQLGNGRVYLFADNNLFINHYFANPDHAIFLNLLFSDYFSDTIYFYEYGTGVREMRNPVMVLFQGNFLFLTLHLLLMGLVFAAWQSRRFGKPLHAEPFKRRSLDIHLAAVGNFYRKAGALQIVEALTRKYFIKRTKQLLNIKKSMTDNELVEKLAEFTGENPGKLNVLLEKPTGLPEKTLFKKRKDIYRVMMTIKNHKQRKKAGQRR
jgi:hypothetical protein